MMNHGLIQKLKDWRTQKGRKENTELFKILHNSTIESIADAMPKNKEEFLATRGLGEKKYQKYGEEILLMVKEFLPKSDSTEIESNSMIRQENKEREYTVSKYLSHLNSKLIDEKAIVRGEVAEVGIRDNYLFFDLKDSDDNSMMGCFMWKSDYEICGVEIKEGMELTIYGFPEIYKPSGRFNFRTSTIELVGEGALKKAYEELKKKLESEGLFEEARKKSIPDYPHKIGLITSRDGAVINDFRNNIGRFGYKITFVDSRVEGMMAVKDLIEAVKYFQGKSVDVLVIIRGGGSLESLRAFNNEALIREILSLPMPVLCGIGHDKDVPLLSLLADGAVSTPTAVAQALNKSWENAIHKVERCEQNIISSFDGIIIDSKNKFEKIIIQIKEFHSHIFTIFEQHERNIKNYLAMIKNSITHIKERLGNIINSMLIDYRNNLNDTNKLINNMQKTINVNNPERQLKLGYSIVSLDGKIIKSTEQVDVGSDINVKVSDGEIKSKVKNISKN